VTTKYCYDGDQVIAEYDGSDNLLRKFVYGPGIDEPICMVDVADSNAVYYYHFDGLGSVAALSDVNKVIVERYSYDVFGAPTIYDVNSSEISQSAIGNPYMFTARRADDETALYYYRARYYAFDIGRFLQTDPIGYYDGLNMYSYCGNNPVSWNDPLGLLVVTGEYKAIHYNPVPFIAGTPFGLTIYRNDAARRVGLYFDYGGTAGVQIVSAQYSEGVITDAFEMEDYEDGFLQAEGQAQIFPAASVGLEGAIASKDAQINLSLTPDWSGAKQVDLVVSASPPILPVSGSYGKAKYKRIPLPKFLERIAWWLINPERIWKYKRPKNPELEVDAITQADPGWQGRKKCK
jgi:RHS repeat-associated protein